MRYITLKKTNKNIDFDSSIDDAIVRLMEIQLAHYVYDYENECILYIYYLLNDINIDLLSNKYKNFFHIKELNENELINKLNDLDFIRYYYLDEFGYILYEERNQYLYNVRKNNKPTKYSKWFDEISDWLIPENNINNEYYNEIEINSEETILEKKICQDRNLRRFYIWPCSEAYLESEFQQDFLFLETYLNNKKISTDQFINFADNIKYQQLLVDICPIGIISYIELEEENDLLLSFLEQSVILTAPTMQELFKLIIVNYGIFWSNEKTPAIEDFLKSIDMSNDIMNIFVEKVETENDGNRECFIKNVDEKFLDDIDMASFISEMYKKYTLKSTKVTLNID